MVALVPVATDAPQPRFGRLTEDEVGAMFRAVLNLFERWEVSAAQAAMLLDVSPRTYARWKSRRRPEAMGQDGALRLSNLMGIHKALRIVFAEPQRGYAWIGKPNERFGGKTALEAMLEGGLPGIMRVRRYLDSERGGW
jgi:hypothetical protein